MASSRTEMREPSCLAAVSRPSGDGFSAPGTQSDGAAIRPPRVKMATPSRNARRWTVKAIAGALPNPGRGTTPCSRRLLPHAPLSSCSPNVITIPAEGNLRRCKNSSARRGWESRAPDASVAGRYLPISPEREEFAVDKIFERVDNYPYRILPLFINPFGTRLGLLLRSWPSVNAQRQAFGTTPPTRTIE